MTPVVVSPSPSLYTRIAGRFQCSPGNRIAAGRRSPHSSLSPLGGIAPRLAGAVLAALIVGARADAQLVHPELMELDSGLEFASAAVKAGRFEDAKRSFLQLQELFPDAVEPHLGLANLTLALGETQAAWRAFGEALRRARHDDHRAQAQLGQGRAALRHGDPETARRHFRAAEYYEPRSALAANGLGVVANIRGDHEAAIAHYRRARALAPGDSRIEANLIRTLAAQGLVQEAGELYRSRPDTYWRPDDRDKLWLLFGDPTGSEPTVPESGSTDEGSAQPAEAKKPAPPGATSSGPAEPAPTQHRGLPAPDPGGTEAVEAPRQAVQVGSYRSLEGARQAWARLSGAHPKLLGELDHEILLIDTGPGRENLHRLKAGPLESRDHAVQLCRRLKRLGVDCLPAEMRAP